MQIYLLRVLLWETSIQQAAFLQSLGGWGGIIDPKNVLNDLRVSISPGALMYQTKGKACKEETNFMYICEEEKKERTRSANCKTETEYKFML